MLRLVLLQAIIGSGGVAEWLKAAVLKTVRPERVSGVRIPPPPPYLTNAVKMRLLAPCYYFFYVHADLKYHSGKYTKVQNCTVCFLR